MCGRICAQLAATHDTVNTERIFCTTNGRTVQVYSSVYGWKIDQEKEIETIIQEMIAGVQINREPVYAMRANARGMNDIAARILKWTCLHSIYITIRMVLSFWNRILCQEICSMQNGRHHREFSTILQEKSICAERKDAGKWEI